MREKLKLVRDWLVQKLQWKKLQADWRQRVQAARLSLGSMSKGIHWSRVLTKKGIIYFSALLMGIVTLAGALYLIRWFPPAQEPSPRDALEVSERLSYPAGETSGGGSTPEGNQEEKIGDTVGEVEEEKPQGWEEIDKPRQEPPPAEDSQEAVGEKFKVEGDPVVAAAGQAFSPPPMTMPVAGERGDGIGWREHPVLGGWRFNTGLEIKAPSGTPVKAAWRGTVAAVTEDPLLGQVIILEHGQGWETRYGGCGQVSVQTGQHVEQGDGLAVVGEPELLDEALLHFELRHEGQVLDPEEYLPDPDD